MQLSWLISVLVVLLLIAAVPAYAAQFAAAYLLRFKPALSRLIFLVIGSLLIAAVVDALYNFISLGSIQLSQEKDFTPLAIFFIAKFVLFANFLRFPESGAIGYTNALKVAALSMVIEIIALFVMAFIFMGIFNVLA